MKKEYLTNSPGQTKKLGQKLAKKILKTALKDSAFVIGLIGELGGGKTTFLQGFAKGLGIEARILSPTFVIMKRFQVPEGKTTHYSLPTTHWFYHFDCYRIEKPQEILNLGFKEIIADPQNIVTIEWAERIKKILPESALIIKFQFVDKNKRKITIKE